jgi:methylamine dehydrogenase heavy chain
LKTISLSLPLMVCCLAGAAQAGSVGTSVAPDQLGAVERLPASPKPHWVWINDASLGAMPDGRALLIDGDEGRALGFLNTGYSFSSLTIPKGARTLYSAETYYSRGTRGTRTDVVSFYDPATLSPIGEVILPTKRASTIPRLSDAALTDNDQFLAVFNLTPAASLSIVDVRARKPIGSIDIPGCAMAYGGGQRRILSLCADGSVMSSEFDERGRMTQRSALAHFFTLEDPIIETGVRFHDNWLFVSFAGVVHSLQAGSAGVAALPRWDLLGAREREGHWLPGGLQPLAVHNGRGELYVLMHHSAPSNFKMPGTEVWVYDIGSHARLRRIPLGGAVRSIQVSQDGEPLLFALSADTSLLSILDAQSGTPLRTVTEIGATPMLLLTPWTPPG